MRIFLRACRLLTRNIKNPTWGTAIGIGVLTLATGCTSRPTGDPFAITYEAFGIVLVAALVGRFLARRLNVSLVLGEICMGIIIGTVLSLSGRPLVTILRHQSTIQEIIAKLDDDVPLSKAVASTIDDHNLEAPEYEVLSETFAAGGAGRFIQLARVLLLFSSIGIAMMLFTVGLQSNISEIIRRGPTAIVIACTGIVVSGVLGYLATTLLFPGADPLVPLFIGGALCASSTGMTARVFGELNLMESPEAKIVLSAAVFDDVLGLVILAIVSGIVSTGSVQLLPMALILLKAGLFLTAMVLIGLYVLPRIVPSIEQLDPQQIRLLFPIVLLLLICWLADFVGLAMTIGAFSAGLIINETLFSKTTDGQLTVQRLVAPIEGIFVPVFFVLMGMQVDITLMADPKVIGAGLVMTVVAILGKIGVGIFLPANVRKLAVGLAMIPRGEVALIFMSIGKTLGVINAQHYTMIVVVVLMTIAITPPLLQRAFRQGH